MSRRVIRTSGVVAALMTAWACGGTSTSPDAGTKNAPDAGTSDDGGGPDASDQDAGTIDGGTDAGIDAGVGTHATLTLHAGAPLADPTEVVGSSVGLPSGVVDASHDVAGNQWAVDSSHVYVRRAGLGAVESFGTGS